MNTDLNPEFIERYQLLLQKDPRSKVFAPLAEAYRKMGMLDAAEKLGLEGVKNHPNFPSGRVVLAKIMIEKDNREGAVEQLKAAADLSPENILAHRLLAQTLLELRKPKDALKAFKMVLFLNPNDEVATRNVKKLESLTADEYEDELFEMKPLPRAANKMAAMDQEDFGEPQSEFAPKSMAPTHPSTAGATAVTSAQLPRFQRTLERAISLADAFVVRADFDKALRALDEAEEQIGAHPEITKRRRFLLHRNAPLASRVEEPTVLKPIIENFKNQKIQKVERLKSMLQRVNGRRVE